MQTYLLLGITESGNLFVDGPAQYDKLRAYGLLDCARDYIGDQHKRRVEARAKAAPKPEEPKVEPPAEKPEPGNG